MSDVKLLLDGDAKNFRKFYDLYFSKVHRICYGILGHNKDVVEDCVQEMFILIWRRRKTFCAADNFEHYLLRSIRNKAIDYAISLQNKKRAEVAIDEDRHDNAQQPTVYGSIYYFETARKVRESLSIFPPKAKRILTLAILGGWSRTDIANELGVSTVHVYNTISINMDKIRDRINEYSQNM